MKNCHFKKSILLISLLSVGKLFAATIVPPTSAMLNPADVTWGLESQIPSSLMMPSQTVTQAPRGHLLSAPTKLTGPSFVLKDIQFIHDYPIPREVLAAYQNSLNKPIDFQGLQVLAQKIQDVYRNAGDILVRVIIPPQQIDEKVGIVKFQVIEGQIQNVIFKGDALKGAKAQLQRYAQEIDDENPINYKNLKHFLALANSLPGISVTSTIVPSQTVVGGADLVIDVKRKGAFANVSFNNYGNQYVGPGQAFMNVGLNDLFAADSLSMSAATSTHNPYQMSYLSESYDIIAGPYSTEINPVYSETITHPGDDLSNLAMKGVSDKFTLNVNQPLMVTRTQNLTFISSIYHLQSKNMVFGDYEVYNDLITALTAGLQFKGLLGHTYNNMDVYTTIGMPILGAPATLQDPSRSNGKTEFVMLDFDTSTIQYFTQKWSYVLATTGQMTPQPMLTSEQLGFGGPQFGQGLGSYALSGDNGVLGSFALRYDLPSYYFIDLLQPQAFYSAGIVGNNQSQLGTDNRAWASTAGFGLNMVFLNTLQVTTNFAKTLNISNGINNSKAWQFYISAAASF